MLTWNGPITCPNCGTKQGVGIMSLAKTCDCGWYYVDTVKGERGWYRSRAAYHDGEQPVSDRTEEIEAYDGMRL